MTDADKVAREWGKDSRVSKCCKARLLLTGDPDRWYECAKCKKSAEAEDAKS